MKPSNSRLWVSPAAVAGILGVVATGVLVWSGWVVQKEKTRKKNQAKQRLKQIRRDLALQKSTIAYIKDLKLETVGEDPVNMIRYGRDSIQWMLVDMEARVRVLKEVVTLADDEKLEILFELIDVDGNRNLDLYEIEQLVRKYSAYNQVYLELAESLRISKRKIQSFDQDGDFMLNIREFKAFVRSLAQKGNNTLAEMCELLTVCLFVNDPEECKSDDHQESPNRDSFEQEFQRFRQKNEDRFQGAFDLFKKDDQGDISMGHVQLLIAVTKAKFDGETCRLTLDDMDEGQINYETFVRIVFRAISTQTFQDVTAEAFFQFLLAILQWSDGNFEEFDASAIQGVRPRLRGALVPLSTQDAVPVASTGQGDEDGNNNQQESERPALNESAVRRSTRILHAATLTRSALQREEMSGISEYVKVEKMMLETGILALRQKLELLENFAATDNKGKVALLFHLFDRNGDGRINALELAEGLLRFTGAGDFSESLSIAMSSLANFDTDGDAMLDLDEFDKYIHSVVSSLVGDDSDKSFEWMCASLILVLLMSEVDSKEEMEEYSEKQYVPSSN